MFSKYVHSFHNYSLSFRCCPPSFYKNVMLMCLHKHIRSWRRRHFSCSNKQIAFWLIGVVNFVSRERLNCFIKTLFCTCVINLNTKQEVNSHFYWYLLTFWFRSVFWSVQGMFTFLILVYVQDGWTPLLFANNSCNPLEPPYK